MAQRGPPPPVHPVVEGVNDIEATLAPELLAAHKEAMDLGLPTYIDPDTGFTVFTRQQHITRGKCCGSRCRHCPYAHAAVPEHLKVPVATPSAPVVEHKASVYTRTGDKGQSSLFTGERHSKADLVFEALGTVDELSSFVGVAKEAIRAVRGECDHTAHLDGIQQRLLDVGSIVATPGAEAVYQSDEWTADLERRINALDAALPPIDAFILPGGSPAAAHVHVCRSVTRRAERCMVRLHDNPTYRRPVSYASAMRYVNRLSDYFFVLARTLAERPDVLRE